MSTWWEFGEHSGFDGSDLVLFRIHCGFCTESGHFERMHHIEKTHPTTSKVLNYDTMKCANCGNLTMVFWSAATHSGSRGLHDFKTLPWPRETTHFPSHWPEEVGRFWLQARRSLEGKNWDAAVVMARTAVQQVARLNGATGRNLKEEINDLGSRGLLPPVMQEWSHEVRELGNDSAHPTPGSNGATSKDAQDLVDFLSMLLTIVYNLPHEISQYRARKGT
jgi:Domain of unknown function (DUF4145)